MRKITTNKGINTKKIQEIENYSYSLGMLTNPNLINVKIILNNCANIFMYNCSIIFIRYFG